MQIFRVRENSACSRHEVVRKEARKETMMRHEIMKGRYHGEEFRLNPRDNGSHCSKILATGVLSTCSERQKMY